MTASHLARAQSLLRITAHRKVASLLEGEYTALHPGRSTEFSDLREYVRGDDPKDLDWKASARARTLLVRRYDALRKLTVLLVVSTGRSMAAASTVEVTKREVGIALAGVIGSLAVRRGDLVGMVHGDRDGQTVIPARGGAAHAERALRSASDATSPQSAPSDLEALLRGVARSVRRRGFVVVVADPVAVDDGAVAAFRRLQVQHEVLVAVVDGLNPMEVPPRHDRALVDVDDAGSVPAWLRSDPGLAEETTGVLTRDRLDLESRLDRLGLAHVRVGEVADVVPAVLRLLEAHRRAGR